MKVLVEKNSRGLPSHGRKSFARGNIFELLQHNRVKEEELDFFCPPHPVVRRDGSFVIGGGELSETSKLFGLIEFLSPVAFSTLSSFLISLADHRSFLRCKT